ncbi:uncharacterized protein LOC143939344 [Lithobates pipiens]
MAGREVLILCVSIINAVLGSHMQGGTSSFRVREKYANGWVVDIKYRTGFESSSSYRFSWRCLSGNCGTELQNTITLMENKTTRPSRWYQNEGHMKRRVPIDKPFQLGESSCCWVTNVYTDGSWSLITAVDLGTRSDTKKPNTSPVTASIQVLRIPQNCATSINLLSHDPDGDHVTCRNAYNSGECGLCKPYFSVDESRCIISFPSGIRTGAYVLELVVEDFPNKNINLTYYDRTTVFKNSPYHRKIREAPNDSEKKRYWGPTTDDSKIATDDFYDDIIEGTTSHPNAQTDVGTISVEHFVETTHVQETSQTILSETVTISDKASTLHLASAAPDYTNPLSRIPLQFMVEATSPAPSCTFGHYRPIFLSPTPSHGTILQINAGKKFQLHLTAQAAYERIADFKVSGLPGMTKSFTSASSSDIRTMVVEWTPTEDNIDEHVPVCFVAETSNWYHSEMRCIVLVVGPSELVDTTLICHENTMTLIVAKSADAQFNNTQFRLNDPACLVSSNSTHLIASAGYNSCGTEIEETEENIVFKNTATSYDTSVIITRQNGISIPFNCSFPKKNRVSASFRAHKSDYVFSEAGFGNFTYKFQFFTDSRFVDVDTQSPLEVVLKQLLYMEIQVSSSLSNVQLFVESCRATPHDNPSDPVFYDIIQNGCIKDNTVVVYPGSGTQYRFAMEAFAFIGTYPEVYISCTVILCKMGATNTRCTQGCITKSMEAFSNHRDRRSLVSESQQHFISQGPVIMKREIPTDKGVEKTSSVNGTTRLIALSGMVAVALISITLNIYMKRARAAGYQRLNTQDF